MKIVLFALSLLLTTSSYALPVSLAGDTIDAMMIRTIDTGYGTGRINGYGLDAPFIVVDGPSDKKTYSSAFDLDVDGDRFTINFLSSAGWQPGTVFRLDDLDFSTPAESILTDLDIFTNLTGYTLNVGNDFIELGLGGTRFDTDTFFTGHFVVSSAPEPSAFMLIMPGLLACWLSSRRRSKPYQSNRNQ